MASILDNFVTVNIGRHTSSLRAGDYDTAIYVATITNDLTEGYYSQYGSSAKSGIDKANSKTALATDNYMKVFFENGGKYLHVIAPNKFTKAAIENETIPIDEIVVFKDSDASPNYWPSESSTAPQSEFVPAEGVYQKILIVSHTVTSGSGTVKEASPDDKHSGVVYKYPLDTDTSAKDYTSVAATAAYYTQLNINAADSAKDYAFTAETVIGDPVTSGAVVEGCIANDYNCDVKIAGAVRNIGGNDLMGEALTNLYMRIVLQQQARINLFNLLATKIKYDDRGVTQVKSVLSSTMQKFINNGYIALNKVWTDIDLYIDGEKVIATGTPLISGYLVHVSPFTSLSETARKNHQFPAITLIYGDAIGIRKIVVGGEVF